MGVSVDFELMTRIKNGDIKAKEALFEKYKPLMNKMVKKLLTLKWGNKYYVKTLTFMQRQENVPDKRKRRKIIAIEREVAVFRHFFSKRR